MKEMWKKIRGYDNYEVSNLGRVRSLARPMTSRGDMPRRENKILKQNGQRYNKIVLHKNGIKISPNVHVLVATHFILNPDKKPCINHKDGNKRNNNIKNLEWCTSQENCIDSLKRFPRYGIFNPKAKLTNNQVKKIRKMATNNSITSIAKTYGVTPANICDIIKRKTWTHF